MTESRTNTGEQSGAAVVMPDADCCDVWPLIAKNLKWMAYDGNIGVVTMPHLEGTDRHLYFVNFCPSCGANARNRNMKWEDVQA